MAYDSTIPAGGHGNFVSPNLAHEGEGVAVDFVTVDLLATATGEVTHPYASAATWSSYDQRMFCKQRSKHLRKWCYNCGT